LGTFDALVPFSVLILEPGSIGYGKWNAFALLNFAPLMLAGIVASFGKIFATTDRPKKGILAVVVVFALIPPGCSAVVRKAGYLCGW
jgi:hypothetical protein